MATAVLTKGTLRTVPFRLDGRLVPEAHSVALVASFNRWDTSVHRLRHEPDGSWALSVILPPGEYSYLFVVDGVPWNDPQDDGRAPVSGEDRIRCGLFTNSSSVRVPFSQCAGDHPAAVFRPVLGIARRVYPAEPGVSVSAHRAPS